MLAALILALTFAGCEKDPDSDELSGKTYTAYDGYVVVEFGSNGTFTETNNVGEPEEESYRGTYTVNGNTATLTTTEGDAITVTTSDNWNTFVVIGDDGYTTTFTRQ